MSTGSYSDTEPPYDPDLPFLEALEREVHSNALRAAHRRKRSHETRSTAAWLTTARGTAARSGSRSDPLERTDAANPVSMNKRMQRDWMATEPVHKRVLKDTRPGIGAAPRIARRSLTLVALICLIGASAFGAGKILSGTAPNPSVVHQGPIVSVASGQAGSDRWSLRLYRRDSDLCRALVVTETEASHCAPAPGVGALAVTSVVSPLRRYVFGVSGSDVTDVSMRVGTSTLTVPTHSLDTSSLHAGLPAHIRWFVAILKRPADAYNPPALVHGIEAKHGASETTHMSCVETVEAQSCR
jgi:hypothetical protein